MSDKYQIPNPNNVKDNQESLGKNLSNEDSEKVGRKRQKRVKREIGAPILKETE
jgi:hypothetical protein